MCDEGRGVGSSKLAVYLDFQDAINRLGAPVIREKYGNLFQMYEKITDDDPYKVPMRIFPAVHYVMGGLWVDYNLMSTVPGLHVLGEANFSDHGANRLGASALMQGLADGYFVIPYTIGNYIAGTQLAKVDTNHAAFNEAEAEVCAQTDRLLKVGAKGKKTVLEFYRELGLIMWDHVGMERNAKGLEEAIKKIQALRKEFWTDLKLLGGDKEFNKNLEVAGRLADFLELGELMARDALNRNESCGGHYRSESSTPDGEAQRKDEEFSYVAAWEYKGADKEPALHKEKLEFENVHLAQRSYK
jgi:succinate dehydrogenase / fumarate reductase flavoprotein subunit